MVRLLESATAAALLALVVLLFGRDALGDTAFWWIFTPIAAAFVAGVIALWVMDGRRRRGKP